MTSGGSGAWRSRGSARRDAEACQPDAAGREVHQHIGRLDVLMDETTFV